MITEPFIPPPPRRPGGRAADVFVVIATFAILIAAVAFFGGRNGRLEVDQDLFHWPAVRQFIAQWPRPDLRNYASATAPGYHLFVAAVGRYVRVDLTTLRVAGGAFGFVLVALLATAARRRSAYLALPAAASVYVLSSTVWLLPENAAWLLVTVGLLLALRAAGSRFYVASAVTLAVLVFVRQSHVWLAAATLAASYSLSRYGRDRVRVRADDDGLGRSGLLSTLSYPESISINQRQALRRAVVSTLFTLLPAAAVLVALVVLWHGLTPPAFRINSGVDLPSATKVGGLAPAAPAMVLALIGLFGTPLLAWLWPGDASVRVARWLAIGVAAGFVLGVLPVTTYNFERRSGIWNLVHALPTVANRSPVMIGLATLGGGVAAVTLAGLRPRARRVLAAALAGFTLTQTANALVWQRYYEPFVLLWLILAAASAAPAPASVTRRRLQALGLAAVTLFQLAVTAYTLRRGN